MNTTRRNSDKKDIKKSSRSSSLSSSVSGASTASNVSSNLPLSNNKVKVVRRPSLPKKAPSSASSIVSSQSVASKRPSIVARANSGEPVSKSLGQDRRGSATSIKSTRRGSGTELFNMFAILAPWGCGGHYRILPDPVPIFNKEGGIDVTYITGGGKERHSAATEWEVKMLRKLGLPKLSKPDNKPGARLSKQLVNLITTKFIVFMCDNGETCIVPNPEALEEGDLE